MKNQKLSIKEQFNQNFCILDFVFYDLSFWINCLAFYSVIFSSLLNSSSFAGGKYNGRRCK